MLLDLGEAPECSIGEYFQEARLVFFSAPMATNDTASALRMQHR